MDLNDSQTLPMEGVEWFGVAIRRNPNNSTHIGIIYKLDNNQVCFLLHLGTDNDLKKDVANNSAGYFWLNVEFNVEEKVFLAAFSELVSQENGVQITYGFDTSGKFFDLTTGKFIPGRSGPGLTCATFVLELIESKFQLIEKSTWPKSGKQDVKWRKTMLEILRLNGMPLSVFDYQKTKIGNKRFKPEHIAAATQSKIRPACYLKIKPDAEKILNTIPTR